MSALMPPRRWEVEPALADLLEIAARAIRESGLAAEFAPARRVTLVVDFEIRRISVDAGRKP